MSELAIQMLQEVTYCPGGFDEVVLKKGEVYSVDADMANAFISYNKAVEVQASQSVAVPENVPVIENTGGAVLPTDNEFVSHGDAVQTDNALKTEIDILTSKLDGMRTVVESSNEIIAKLETENKGLQAKATERDETIKTLEGMIDEMENAKPPEPAKPKRGRPKSSGRVMRQRKKPEQKGVGDGKLSDQNE